MSILTQSIPFVLLCLALLSLWIRRDVKIWGPLLGLSVVAGMYSGNILVSGFYILVGWAFLWVLYAKKKKPIVHIVFFTAMVVISFGFKFHLFPGFQPITFSPGFMVGLEVPYIELVPLLFFVPLAKSIKDWKEVFLKGVLPGCAGIAILAVIAVASGSISWQFKLPTFAAARYLSNFFLTAIPEEGFYRGFVQRELCRFFPEGRKGQLLALLVTSLIFTLAHVYWSPNIAILGFVFLASLLYGGVYLISGKIESAIICHFILNFIHMTFFSYHAM